ncbi:LysR family transcriptional regulator [Leisingera daeponensis]|uniref:LysR family transcriptional regulator n=1 Tax=Leisingera daeponensis TaxID=405746 RepID=A0ABS7ND72_9RHOB|nr:LysR family transcriptional regulator [Leisingera daeponensis]MBY6139142.1 LysR family transcriptional regulator [Leisingera daeponensis]
MQRSIRPTSGSLNSLLVLEVAVRHASLSRAAAELGMSQPAVSRHISTLEGRLRQPLFERNNNRIAPTANATRLADAVALGLGHVDQAWSEVLAAPETDEVTLACTFGFADQWLMPRYSDLRASLGGTRVRVVTTDQLGDIDLSRLDAAVVWDPARMPERPYFPLVPAETFPICSPGFLEAYPEAAENLSALPPNLFLHFDTGTSGFLTWRGWFEQAGLPQPRFGKAPEFDAYPFLLQSVRRGEGIGLGWTGIADNALACGEVLRLGPAVSDRPYSYFVQHRAPAASSSALEQLLDWFRCQSPLLQSQP